MPRVRSETAAASPCSCRTVVNVAKAASRMSPRRSLRHRRYHACAIRKPHRTHVSCWGLDLDGEPRQRDDELTVNGRATGRDVGWPLRSARSRRAPDHSCTPCSRVARIDFAGATTPAADFRRRELHELIRTCRIPPRSPPAPLRSRSGMISAARSSPAASRAGGPTTSASSATARRTRIRRRSRSRSGPGAVISNRSRATSSASRGSAATGRGLVLGR